MEDLSEALPDFEAEYPDAAKKYKEEHPEGEIRFLYDTTGEPEYALLSSNTKVNPCFKQYSIKYVPLLPETILQHLKGNGKTSVRFTENSKVRTALVNASINSKPLYAWIEQQLESQATRMSEV